MAQQFQSGNADPSSTFYPTPTFPTSLIKRKAEKRAGTASPSLLALFRFEVTWLEMFVKICQVCQEKTHLYMH